MMMSACPGKEDLSGKRLQLFGGPCPGYLMFVTGRAQPHVCAQSRKLGALHVHSGQLGHGMRTCVSLQRRI